MIARIASSGRLTEEERERTNRRNRRLDREDYEWLRTPCSACAEVGAQEDRDKFQASIEEARLATRNEHRLKGNEDDDFGRVNGEEMTSSVDEFTGAIALVVTPITRISLIVGGIRVMNVMPRCRPRCRFGRSPAA